MESPIQAQQIHVLLGEWPGREDAACCTCCVRFLCRDSTVEFNQGDLWVIRYKLIRHLLADNSVELV